MRDTEGTMTGGEMTGSGGMCRSLQWRIQDFARGGAPTPKNAIIFQFFAENCMKMKEFGPPGGARVPGAPPWIREWFSTRSG